MPLNKLYNKDSLLLNLEDIKASFPPNLIKKHSSYFKLFHINKIEDYRHFLNVKQPPYRKSVHDFLFLTRGSSIRTKGLDKYKVKANSIFFVPAYQIRTVESMSKDTTGYFCHFDTEIFIRSKISADILNQFSFLHYISNPLITIPKKSTTEVLHICERLEKLYNENYHRENFILFCSYLLCLFSEMNQFVQKEPANQTTAALLTQKYKNALMEHIYDIYTVAGYAKLLGISQNYLNRCLLNTIGKSAHEVLNEMLLLEAKSLIKQTTMSISEIAYKVGKKDHSDFSRFFKLHVGVTPSEYRQKILE